MRKDSKIKSSIKLSVQHSPRRIQTTPQHTRSFHIWIRGGRNVLQILTNITQAGEQCFQHLCVIIVDATDTGGAGCRTHG
eukprot:Transcript_19238.p2 GENE.Transcript_19238~~Transcript_19238.p2  ORF type:complete len:80 (+),score=5.71 Transcript_19238:208-447(+)